MVYFKFLFIGVPGLFCEVLWGLNIQYATSGLYTPTVRPLILRAANRLLFWHSYDMLQIRRFSRTAALLNHEWSFYIVDYPFYICLCFRPLPQGLNSIDSKTHPTFPMTPAPGTRERFCF